MNTPIISIALTNLTLAAIGFLFALNRDAMQDPLLLVFPAILVACNGVYALRGLGLQFGDTGMDKKTDNKVQGQFDDEPLGTFIEPRGPHRAEQKLLLEVMRTVEDEGLPPWLRVKDNIVMTWRGKHHVAALRGRDPFDVAQRLFNRLQSRGAT